MASSLSMVLRDLGLSHYEGLFRQFSIVTVDQLCNLTDTQLVTFGLTNNDERNRLLAWSAHQRANVLPSPMNNMGLDVLTPIVMDSVIRFGARTIVRNVTDNDEEEGDEEGACPAAAAEEAVGGDDGENHQVDDDVGGGMEMFSKLVGFLFG